MSKVGQLPTGYLFTQAAHLVKTPAEQRQAPTDVMVAGFSEQDVNGIDDCIQIAQDEATNYYNESELINAKGQLDDSAIVPIMGTGAVLGALLWAKAHGYRYAEGGVRTNDGDWQVRIWDPEKEIEIQVWNVYYFGS